jgi:regulator of protease activity HflC (stomatin/prohibitin superfamily)
MTTAIEVNCATGEVIERPLTADEIAANEAAAAQAEADRLAAEAEAEAKAQAKADLLAKLGITAEEAALLLA